ncbi:tigger transposable element-derived protein 4-like [Hydractinia symbiolongicarpus]|uniref:tigger transposable element-derived protein 4-like n=1 Tax=Hydractinia symbiolongicarpus TaxID=13093 RepID=UPI00254F2EAC|nr:tigger transposable element-derived protein 4-like [Hydractinia symbiolongicarpus]
MATAQTTSRKKTVLTIKKKYLALKELEKEGTTKKSIAKKYGVPPNALSYWVKNKSDIFAKYESGQYGVKRQKLSSGKYDNIDKAVYKWFVNARERTVPISGQIIREKALDFAKQFNEPDFKASEGWLDRWKYRQNIIYRIISGEEKSCTPGMTASWEETHLPTILSRYDLQDIFNADEFGLFYQMLPTNTYHAKGERCAGGKFSKVRLTGLAAGNALGEKLPMFVIRNSVTPRCFKGVRSLPCQYKAQKKAWMDSENFTDYVKKLDVKFETAGRKIVLIIDNCPAHPEVTGLKAVELVFLPPNTTSKTQPMDQGVIRALKAYYRSNLVKRQIKFIDGGKEVPKINILEGMQILVKSWDAVSKDTVKNCFKKAGISKEAQITSLNDADDPFKSLSDSISELKKREVDGDIFNADDFVDIDFEVCTSKSIELTDEEIVEIVLNEDKDQNAPNLEDDDDDEIEAHDIPPKKPKQSELEEALELLERWSLFDENGLEIRKQLNMITRTCQKHYIDSKKRCSIKDFFKS